MQMESPLLQTVSRSEQSQNAISRLFCLDLEETGKQIAIAVPMIITNLSVYSIILIPVMFAGHLGQLELAAATLANSWAFVTGFALMNGLSGGLETLCGQGYGAKAYRMLGIYLQSSLISTFLFSIIVSVLWLYAEPILICLHQNVEVSELASVYLRWMIPGIYAYSCLQCLTRFLQTQSIVLPLILCSVIPLAIGTALSYLLVLKTGLGFKGAPVAASVSLWVSVFLLALYVNLSENFEETWQGISMECFQYILPFMKLAIPSAVMVCLEYWAFEILVLLAGLLPNSEESTSLLAMCVNTENITYMITFGFSAAVSTRVSNEIGAGNHVQAENAVSVTLKLAAVLAVTIVMMLAFGHGIWASAFSSIQRIKQEFSSMTPLLAVSILLDTNQGVLAGVARGSGWQHLAAWTNLAAFYAIGVPISVFLAFKFDLYAKVHVAEHIFQQILNSFSWRCSQGLWVGLICGMLCQTCILLSITVCTGWSRMPIIQSPPDVRHP